MVDDIALLRLYQRNHTAKKNSCYDPFYKKRHSCPFSCIRKGMGFYDAGTECEVAGWGETDNTRIFKVSA